MRRLLLAVVLAALCLGALWYKNAPSPTTARVLAPAESPAGDAAGAVTELRGDAVEPASRTAPAAGPAKADDPSGTAALSMPAASAEPPGPAPSAEASNAVAAAPPEPVKLAASPPNEEARQFVARARDFIAQGDVTTARLFLERAADRGDARATFALAETYDPLVLARWKARGVAPDIDKARALYIRAGEGGVADARKRLAELVGR